VIFFRELFNFFGVKKTFADHKQIRRLVWGTWGGITVRVTLGGFPGGQHMKHPKKYGLDWIKIWELTWEMFHSFGGNLFFQNGYTFSGFCLEV